MPADWTSTALLALGMTGLGGVVLVLRWWFKYRKHPKLDVARARQAEARQRQERIRRIREQEGGS